MLFIPPYGIGAMAFVVALSFLQFRDPVVNYTWVTQLFGADMSQTLCGRGVLLNTLLLMQFGCTSLWKSINETDFCDRVFFVQHLACPDTEERYPYPSYLFAFQALTYAAAVCNLSRYLIGFKHENQAVKHLDANLVRDMSFSVRDMSSNSFSGSSKSVMSESSSLDCLEGSGHSLVNSRRNSYIASETGKVTLTLALNLTLTITMTFTLSLTLTLTL